MSYANSIGYCDVKDVQARVSAGTWNPGKTGASPTVDQVNVFIAEGATQIDLVIVRRGYTIPLTAAPGMIISPLVYTLLRQINAALATSAVERSRHGSQDEQEDSNAAYWMTFADDMLARIESGADNLALLGVGGTFVPQADQSRAVSMGSTYDSGGNISQPFFRRDSQF